MENLKGKIFPFVVGILVGAIITTCCFLIYTKTHKKEENNPRFNQEQMKDGRGFKGGEKPNGEPESMNNEGGNTERKSKDNSSSKSKNKNSNSDDSSNNENTNTNKNNSNSSSNNDNGNTQMRQPPENGQEPPEKPDGMPNNQPQTNNQNNQQNTNNA